MSAKALRLYERSGLLVPDRVGADGYRTYRVEQVERARLIRLLRQAGMPPAVVGRGGGPGGRAGVAGIGRAVRGALTHYEGMRPPTRRAVRGRGLGAGSRPWWGVAVTSRW
nr:MULTISPECIES: MerR family transcriptional regulator [unclassified Nocardiopsis]